MCSHETSIWIHVVSCLLVRHVNIIVHQGTFVTVAVVVGIVIVVFVFVVAVVFAIVVAVAISFISISSMIIATFIIIITITIISTFKTITFILLYLLIHNLFLSCTIILLAKTVIIDCGDQACRIFIITCLTKTKITQMTAAYE